MKRIPYISILCDPTTGGTSASFAMLGDINIGEPGALISFAGPRVIEQTIRQKLPKEFQRSEFLLEKGMLDMVVNRNDLRDTLTTLVKLLNPHYEKGIDMKSLDFEKPLDELYTQIDELKRLSSESNIDLSDDIANIEKRAQSMKKDIYPSLTPGQILQIARHPNRPTTLHLANLICSEFTELKRGSKHLEMIHQL